MIWLGSDYGKWLIDESLIKLSDIVYSVGIGADNSWDREMVKRFGCMVHMFDPTPDVVSNAAKLVADKLKFYPWGIDSFDSPRAMYHHVENSYQTRSIFPGGSWRGEVECVVPMYTLRRTMDALKHIKIDVLKLCLGGDQEFDVVNSVFNQSISPHTVCFLTVHFSGDKRKEIHARMSTRGYTKLENNNVEPYRWTWTCKQ